MEHPRTLIDALGAQEIADAVGVDARTVINKGRKKFPAAWFVAIRKAAARRGIEASETLFNWKGAA